MKINLQDLIKFAEKQGTVPGMAVLLGKWAGDKLLRRAIGPNEQFSADDLKGYVIIGPMQLGDAMEAYKEIVREKTEGNGGKASGGQNLMPASGEQKKETKEKVASGIRTLAQRLKLALALLVLWGGYILASLFYFFVQIFP